MRCGAFTSNLYDAGGAKLRKEPPERGELASTIHTKKFPIISHISFVEYPPMQPLWRVNCRSQAKPGGATLLVS